MVWWFDKHIKITEWIKHIFLLTSLSVHWNLHFPLSPFWLSVAFVSSFSLNSFFNCLNFSALLLDFFAFSAFSLFCIASKLFSLL